MSRSGTPIATHAGGMTEETVAAPTPKSGPEGLSLLMPKALQRIVLEARARRSARSQRVDRRRHFSLVVLRGDGVRVIRFNFPRPLAVGAFVAIFAFFSSTGALLGDYLKLRRLTRNAVALQQETEERRQTIVTMDRRIAELRAEMTSWRDLHARIQKPFGPGDVIASSHQHGIGGPPAQDPHPLTATPSEELNRLSEVVVEQGDSLRALDRIMVRASKALASLPSMWPVRGGVSSEYGTRKDPWGEGREFHPGIDIGANMATPVLAPAAATVFFAGRQAEYGSMIILDHGQQVRSLYGHLSHIAVKLGQKVERGTLIGYSGNSGRSSGPHLHYEVQVRGQAVNPRTYLWN